MLGPVFWRKRALDLAHDNHTLSTENVRLRDELAALATKGHDGRVCDLAVDSVDTGEGDVG
jgi:hypothetical protein